MLQDIRKRVSGFAGMALSASLSLGIILFLASAQTVDAYAGFARGMIYGGLAAVLLGFGNDTILARLCSEGRVDVRVVVSVRAVCFSLGTLAAALFGMRVMSGFVVISSAIMLHRFYFEMTDRQPFFNLMSVAEKVGLIAILALASLIIGPDHDKVLLAIATAWKAGVSFGFTSLVLRREFGSRQWIKGKSLTALFSVGAPFFMSYLFIQVAAVVASERSASDRIADYGTASQVGSALITAVTFWQRPVIRRYFGRGVDMKSEVMTACIFSVLAATVALVLMTRVGDVFHLAGRESVLWGFCIYAVVFACLHPFELAGYASGNIAPTRVMMAPIVTGILSIPSAFGLGFWSAPFLMLVNTIVVVWSIRQRPDVGGKVA